MALSYLEDGCEYSVKLALRKKFSEIDFNFSIMHTHSKGRYHIETLREDRECVRPADSHLYAGVAWKDKILRKHSMALSAKDIVLTVNAAVA